MAVAELDLEMRHARLTMASAAVSTLGVEHLQHIVEMVVKRCLR